MKVYIGNKKIGLITLKNNFVKIIGDEPPIPVSQVRETRIGYSTITSGVATASKDPKIKKGE